MLLRRREEGPPRLIAGKERGARWHGCAGERNRPVDRIDATWQHVER